jgi:glycine cleavage system transcriptional repressor
MRTEIVLTLTGHDRIGLVEEVTRILLDHGASVGTSRMTRLGGEFAILMLASLAADRVAAVDKAFEAMRTNGYRVSVASSNTPEPTDRSSWLGYRVSVWGADHEGIVHEIARGLASHGVTIESMETTCSSAPVSGIALFALDADVLVPPGLSEDAWSDAVREAGEAAGVDIDIMRHV